MTAWTTSPWCVDCGHEAHAPRKCKERMSWLRVTTLIARGRLPRTLTVRPHCDCDRSETR